MRALLTLARAAARARRAAQRRRGLQAAGLRASRRRAGGAGLDVHEPPPSTGAVKRLRDLGARLLPELTLEASSSSASTLPLLLVWGDRDRMVSHEGARHVLGAAERPLRALEGVGHCPQLEDPSALHRPADGLPRREPLGRGAATPRAAARSRGLLAPTCPGAGRRPRHAMDLIPSPERVSTAAANAFDMVFRGGVADLRRTPAQIIGEAPQRIVYRYLPPDERRPARPAGPARPAAGRAGVCFDLRRGCSLAEHLIAAGHPTYVVEYGDIAFSDKDLGLEYWVRDVLPNAIRRGQRGRRRPARAAARLVPGRDHVAARAGRRRLAAGRVGRARREPVRLPPGAAHGADPRRREHHQRLPRHRALPRARRRARPARQARLPAHRRSTST